MSVTHSFFGKRETTSYNPRGLSVGTAAAATSAAAPALVGGPVAEAGAANGAASTPQPSGAVAQPGAAASPAPGGTTSTGGSQLTVGPGIKLKGVEITDCDTLVVEGTVEATMDSRVIHIAEQGAFHGAAEIDIAEIFGSFTGTLTVRERLVIHRTGRVSGKVRYGKVVIEEGGQLSGEIEAGIQCGAAVHKGAAKDTAPKDAAPKDVSKDATKRAA